MIFEFPVLNEEDHRLPLFIEELGYLKNQDPIVRDRTYTNTQILICTAGSGRLMIDGAEYIISANNVFMTRSHVPHEYHALSEPWTIRWIVFDGNYLDTLFAMLKFGSYEIFHLPSTKPIADIFKEALAMLQSDNPKKHLEFSILLYTMITQLSYYMGTNPLSKKTTKKLQTYGKLLT